jgi:hypothetical protein
MLGLIGPSAHYAGILLLQRVGVGDRLLRGYGEDSRQDDLTASRLRL